MDITFYVVLALIRTCIETQCLTKTYLKAIDSSTQILIVLLEFVLFWKWNVPELMIRFNSIILEMPIKIGFLQKQQHELLTRNPVLNLQHGGRIIVSNIYFLIGARFETIITSWVYGSNKFIFLIVIYQTI
jgi:hypothetical protein